MSKISGTSKLVKSASIAILFLLAAAIGLSMGIYYSDQHHPIKPVSQQKVTVCNCPEIPVGANPVKYCKCD